jgi:hypothetical protein
MFADGSNGFGTASAALSLRVRGGPRDGQIVRLTDAKCTIGASPGCTLRLRGKDVRPVHCLIVRGRANTVVRRWSADTFFNGETFDDRPLTLGDRLRCGPVEFEVVNEHGEAPRLAQPAFGTPALGACADGSGTQVLPNPCGTQVLSNLGGTQVLSNLGGTQVLSPGSMRPQTDPTMTVAMGQVRPFAASSPNAAAPNVTEMLPRSGATPDAVLQQQQQELRRQAAELAERKSQLTQQAAELAKREEQLRQREEEFASRATQIASQSATDTATNAPANVAAVPDPSNASGGTQLDELRKKLDEEREALERGKRELEAQHAIRAAEHARWQEDHRQWKSQRQAAENQMEGLHAQVEHQLAEILARRKNLDQDREAWKSESEQNRRQLEQRAADVARQAEELEDWRKKFEAERQHASQLLEEAGRYEQLRSELASVRADLTARDNELAAARAELARQAAESAQREADSKAALAEATQQHGHADAEYREKLVQLEQQAEELLRIRTQLEREYTEFQAAKQQAQRAEPAPPVKASGLSTLSTWNLLKDRVDFDAEEAPPGAPPARQTSQPVRPSEPIGEDEESIERYMASLIQRVGGKSAQASPTYTPAETSTPASSPSIEPAVVAEAVETIKPEPPRPAIRKAQTVTPEDVAAMRELANLNTRVAITRHGSKRLVYNVMMKAMMTAAAFATAVAVYVLHTEHAPLPTIGAAACAVIGAMFFARTTTAIKQLLASRRGLTAGDEETTAANRPA